MTLTLRQQTTKIMTKQKWYVNIDKAKHRFALEASDVDGHFKAIYKWCVIREYHNSSSYTEKTYFLGGILLNPEVVDKLIEEGKLVKEKTVDIVYDDF